MATSVIPLNQEIILEPYISPQELLDQLRERVAKCDNLVQRCVFTEERALRADCVTTLKEASDLIKKLKYTIDRSYINYGFFFSMVAKWFLFVSNSSRLQRMVDDSYKRRLYLKLLEQAENEYWAIRSRWNKLVLQWLLKDWGQHLEPQLLPASIAEIRKCECDLAMLEDGNNYKKYITDYYLGTLRIYSLNFDAFLNMARPYIGEVNVAHLNLKMSLDLLEECKRVIRSKIRVLREGRENELKMLILKAAKDYGCTLDEDTIFRHLGWYQWVHYYTA